jgi:hypothetical protein
MSGITDLLKDAYDTRVTETLRRVVAMNGSGLYGDPVKLVQSALLKSRRS